MNKRCSEMLPMRFMILSAFFYAAFILAGCDTFTIQGQVVQGPVSSMNFYENGNMGLNELGIDGVTITIYRDPDLLSAKISGVATTDTQGRFVLKLDEFGAGWMLEQWKIVAQRPGYANVIWQQPLTMENNQQKLLITMIPGYSEPISRDELWKQYEQLHTPRQNTNKK